MSYLLRSSRLVVAAGLVLLLGVAFAFRAEGAAPSPSPTPEATVIEGAVEAAPTELAEQAACVIRVAAPAADPATPAPADVLYYVVKDAQGEQLAADLTGQAVIVRGVVSTDADGKLWITVTEYEAVQPPESPVV